LKSVVLLSAGMDSTVNLYEASREGEVVLALSFDYGQRAARPEIESAKKIASLLKVPHRELKLPFFADFGTSSLVDRNKSIPVGAEVSINDQEVSKKSAKSVWVPNRNGIFLNIAAGFAKALNADFIIPGFNKEEASTFPDNSRDFMDQSTKAFSFSTSNRVQVRCSTVNLDKTEIVRKGQALGVNWTMIWPCYLAEATWCGRCESCQRAQRAWGANGISFDDLAKQRISL
jgi:7-cyano-7-deazaguanine synthase